MSSFDISACLIDFSGVPASVKIVEQFPELGSYPEFVNAYDNEIKIAICMADVESPFHKIKHLETRVKAIFEFLDIGLMTLKNKEFFAEVVAYSHKRVIPACCRYIQLQNNHDFASWWSLNIAFYELQKESVKTRETGMDAGKFAQNKASNAREMDKISEMLKTYEARLFKDVKMKQKLVDQELKKISFFPERLAEKFPGF